METCSSAVVLAGGLGTRIRHLSGGLPKPMIAVAGRPFLEWVLRYLAAHGFTRITVSAGYEAHVIARFVEEFALPGVVLTAAVEPEPLGTAGGFLHAIEGDDAPSWLVCNGDSLVLADLTSFVRGIPPRASAVILAVEQEGDRYGRISIRDDGFLQSFGEKQAGAGPINAGVYLFRRETLAHFPRTTPASLEKDVFPALRDVWVQTVDAPFLDIGTEESLARAEEFVIAHRGRFE